MLEKPMALNNRECNEIIEAAAANHIKLMVGHTQQYLSENIHAKKIIQEGALGELVMIHDVRHSNYFSPSRPSWFFEKQKAGGGIFMNLGSHSIDKIQWFTDSKIVKVKASVSYYGAIGDVEGSGIAFVETSSGVAATICQSGYKGVERNETEFIFSNGMMKLVAGQGLWINGNGEYRPSDFDRTDNHFILQFQDLLHSIDSDTEPGCSGAYGKSVVSAVEALYRSSAEGQEIRVAESD